MTDINPEHKGSSSVAEKLSLDGFNKAAPARRVRQPRSNWPAVGTHSRTAWFAKAAIDAFALLSGDRSTRAAYLLYFDRKRAFEEMAAAAAADSFFQAETGIVARFLPALRQHIQPGLALIDLGPGGARSIAQRVSAIAFAIGAREYVGIDASEVVLDAAIEAVTKLLPEIVIRRVRADFFAEEPPLALASSRFVYFGGSTISNLPAETDSFPLDSYTQFFKRLRKLTGHAGYLLLGWHGASVATQALAPYEGPGPEHFFKAPLRVIADLFGADGLEPSAWKYEPAWHSESHCVSHELVCVEAITARFGGRELRYARDDRLVVLRSFKIPPEKMKDLVEGVGFSLSSTLNMALKDSRFGCCMQVRHPVTPLGR